MFLTSLNQISQLGECSNKAQTPLQPIDLFVTNDFSVINDGKSDQSRTGTELDPFINLMDAITKADELAAPYSGQSVTISLTPGIHYILPSSLSHTYIQNGAKDQADRDYNLTIQALNCPTPNFHFLCNGSTETATILNKAGAFFKLSVPRTLTLKGITFDSADSHSTCPEDSLDCDCSQRRQALCEFNPLSRSFTALSSGCECRLAPMTANNCVLPVPNAFVQFDYNTAVDSLLSPKSLLVSNCEFKNMFGTYYNIIELPSQIGAKVTISDSKFHHISSCGSVIGNIAQNQLQLSTTSTYQKGVKAFLDYKFQGQWKRQAEEVIPNYDPMSQSELIIQQSTFSQLDYLFQDDQDGLRLEFDFASYSHYIRASALLLYQTDIPVFIFNNTFEENRLMIGDLLNTTQTQNIPSEASYISRSGIMIESMIYLYRIKAEVQLVKNYIAHNGGTKGPIVIELDYQNTQALSIISQNIFECNTGIVSSGVLSLFSGVNSGTLSSTQTFCGGYLISDNSFIGNTVMLKGGIIRHECSRSDLTFLNYQVFHQYYIESPLAEEKWLDWQLLSFTFQSASKTSTLPTTETVTLNPLVVEIRNNRFELNMRGSEGSVLKFDRTPFFNIQDNSFEANGDILVAGLAHSLDQFVEKATGLWGVKAVGSKFELANRGSTFPLIYSTLSLYYSIQNANAADNWIYSQQTPQVQLCTSFLETKYQASQVVALDHISMANTQIINQKPYLNFFSLREIELNEASTFLSSLDSDEKLSCSMFTFNLAQQGTQMSLSKISVADHVYETKGSQSLLLSIIPFSYDRFSSQAVSGNSQILIIELSMAGIECSRDCSLLRTLTDSVSLLHSQFSNIEFTSQGHLIEMDITDTSITFLNTTSVGIDASRSSSLFKFQESSGASAAMVSFGGLLISNCILNEKLFYISGPALTFNLDSFMIAGVSYEQTNPTTMEGLFHLNNLGSFVIQNTHLQVQSRADIGNYFLRVEGGVGQLVMQHCKFKIMTESTSPISFLDFTLPEVSQSVIINNSTFQGMRRHIGGGGLISVAGSGSLYLNSIEVSYCEAITGGALFIEQQVQMFMQSSYFHHNRAIIIAGSFYGSHSSKSMIQESKFSHNLAKDGAVFYMTMGANLQILNSEFSSNEASDNCGVGLILNNEATSINYFIGAKFLNNKSASSMFYFFFSQTVFDTCQFRDNYCPDQVAGVGVAQSLVAIQNSLFENSIPFLEEFYGTIDTLSDYKLQGFFLNYYLTGFGSITNCIFRNGLGNEGSAIYIGNKSEVEVKFCLFEHNYGKNGAVHIDNAKQGAISDNTFIGNIGDYADVHFSRVIAKFALTNNVILNSIGGSALIRTGDYVLNNNTFSGLIQNSPEIIKLEENVNIVFTANRFFNSNAARAVNFLSNFFTESSPAFVAYNAISNIQGSGNGIGMHLGNSPNMVLQNNQFNQIEFSTLTVNQEGAGIYVDKYSTNVMLNSNSFNDCSASIGGAVSFKNGLVQFVNNIYLRNRGDIYGKDVAAFPVAMELKTYDELPQLFRDQFPRSLSQSFSGLRSGGTIDGFYVVLVDQYGDVVNSSNDNLLTLAIENNESANYLPKYQTLADIREKHGVYDLSLVTFSAQPGKSTKLVINSSAIDPALSSLAEQSYQIDLSFRHCVSGEEYTDDGRCIPCTPGYFSSEAPSRIQACQKCPTNAECFGGTSIAPVQGYWRSSPDSLNFISCFIQSACLGSTENDFYPEGKCFTGYKGILCAQCETGYVRNEQFQCAKCPQNWKNILLLVLILLVAIFVLILLIRTTLQSMKNHRSIVSVYFKILANHFQLIILTISFELEWPSQVQTFYDITQPVADVASRIISLDCFLGTDDQGMKNIYIYLLVYLLLPIVAISGTLLFWFAYIRGNRKKALNRSITTVIILFFLLHPSLTKNVFNIFFCRNIDGDSRLIQDLDIQCYTGKHLYWALIGGGLGLVLWVIGIPWVAWALLREHRNRLHNQEVKERYGFLFNGYKQRTYYWESVVMFRKVAMIFISVFLRSLGTRIQAFTVFLLLLFFVIATVEKKPYLTRKLNNLELISLVTSCTTIYSGFFFLSATESSSPNFDSNKDFSLSSEGKWLFFLIILLSNFVFLLFWSFGLIKEIRGVCRQRFPRFYLCFCLCNRQAVLQEERRSLKAFQANQNIVQEIDKIMLIMKKARTKVIDRETFVDLNKFKNFIQSSSFQMGKLNLERDREENDRRRSSFHNYRVKRATTKDQTRKNSQLDVSQDFNFTQDNNCEIEFQEIIEQPSLNTSHMTSGTELKPKFKYQRTRHHERVSSITGLNSLNTLNDSEKLSHRNIPEENEEGNRNEGVEGEFIDLPDGNEKKSKLKEIAATLLNLPSGHQRPDTAPQTFQSKLPEEFEEKQSQYILDFFESNQGRGPSLEYIPKPIQGRRKSVRVQGEIGGLIKQSKKGKKASQKYEIQKTQASSNMSDKQSSFKHKFTPANTLRSIDSCQQEEIIKDRIQLNEVENQDQRPDNQEIKEPETPLERIEEVPRYEISASLDYRNLGHCSSADSLGSSESNSDLKPPKRVKRQKTYSSFRHASKKEKTPHQREQFLNLVDSFMEGLDEDGQ